MKIDKKRKAWYNRKEKDGFLKTSGLVEFYIIILRRRLRNE